MKDLKIKHILILLFFMLLPSTLFYINTKIEVKHYETLFFISSILGSFSLGVIATLNFINQKEQKK